MFAIVLLDIGVINANIALVMLLHLRTQGVPQERSYLNVLTSFTLDD